MKLTSTGVILSLICSVLPAWGQESGFNSFISRLSDQYQVDVALAPELIPTLDSIRNEGTEYKTIEELLQHLLRQKDISYRIVDGNKILLRREYDQPVDGNIELRGIITEEKSGVPLPFAAVSLMNTSQGSFTDEKGQF